MNRDGGGVCVWGGAYLTEPGHLWCVDTQRNSRCSPGVRRGRLVSRRKVNPWERDKKKELWGSGGGRRFGGTHSVMMPSQKVGETHWILKDRDVYSVRRILLQNTKMILIRFFQPGSHWFTFKNVTGCDLEAYKISVKLMDLNMYWQFSWQMTWNPSVRVFFFIDIWQESRVEIPLCF